MEKSPQPARGRLWRHRLGQQVLYGDDLASATEPGGEIGLQRVALHPALFKNNNIGLQPNEVAPVGKEAFRCRRTCNDNANIRSLPKPRAIKIRPIAKYGRRYHGGV